jgi:hypothetical protein
MIKIKFVAIALVGALAFSTISAINTFAATVDNNIAYGFKIESWHQNSRVSDEEARYRTTTNIYDQWKVKLEHSGEGEGTYTTFWMENSGETNVTDAVDVKQGATPYYNPTRESAGRTYCYLTAENNNYNWDTYYVSGVWDEETGVINYY